MINTDRIVPVTKIDLLSLYKTMLNVAGTEVTVLPAETVDGIFVINEEGVYIANQPVKRVFVNQDGVLYFVAAYDYEGFCANDVLIETGGIEVVADDATLYMATLDNGIITISEAEGNASDGGDDGGGK